MTWNLSRAPVTNTRFFVTGASFSQAPPKEMSREGAAGRPGGPVPDRRWLEMTAIVPGMGYRDNGPRVLIFLNRNPYPWLNPRSWGKQEEAERRLQCIFRPVCSTVSRPWCSQVLITHSVSKTKTKEVLTGVRGCVVHTGLSCFYSCVEVHLHHQERPECTFSWVCWPPMTVPKADCRGICAQKRISLKAVVLMATPSTDGHPRQ